MSKVTFYYSRSKYFALKSDSETLALMLVKGFKLKLHFF